MRKTLKFLIASGACLVMAGTGQMSAQAAMNLETDAPATSTTMAAFSTCAGRWIHRLPTTIMISTKS